MSFRKSLFFKQFWSIADIETERKDSARGLIVNESTVD